RGENTYIVTVRGRGYRFAAPVIESAAATQPAEAKRIQTFNLVPIVTVLLIPFAAAAVLLLGEREPTPTPEAATPTLAVLPFRPLTATDRNESLELGMAEALIAGLNTAELTVSPLSAVRRFTDVEQDAVSAGRALGVHSVLEGHIQRDGDRLRI